MILTTSQLLDLLGFDVFGFDVSEIHGGFCTGGRAEGRHALI
jgi:hypothetical protein